MGRTIGSVLFAGLVSLASSGCITFPISPVGLPEDGNVVFDSSLLGDWQRIDPRFSQDVRMMRVERRSPDSNDYVVTSINNGKPDDRIEGVRVVRLAGVDFMDVPLAVDASVDPKAAKRPQDLHLIFRMRRQGNLLAWDLPKTVFVEKTPEAMRPEVRQRLGESAVLVGSQKELRDFLEENARKESVWDTTSSSIYRKVGQRGEVLPSPQTVP